MPKSTPVDANEMPKQDASATLWEEALHMPKQDASATLLGGFLPQETLQRGDQLVRLNGFGEVVIHACRQ